MDGDGSPLPFDQRGDGFPRIVGAAVDIGAFEAPYPPLAVDATLVDASSVQFAGAYAVRSALEDVDGDGDLDMVLHFRLQETNLANVYAGLLAEDPASNHQSASVRLEGETINDELFAGEDLSTCFLLASHCASYSRSRMIYCLPERPGAEFHNLSKPTDAP